jgi:alkanesulfonate monooxygenase SsuD/methylene tetrahydromethanopterin reductase-like flavin-dependent oxidoreductase (luciferase family)
MRYGISVPNFCPVELGLAEGSHIHNVVRWARAAEAAGWDGFFIWDHLLFWKGWPLQVDDPWVLLAAIAAATERIHIGPMVTPVPRRRPWKLAREVVSLDHLSGGRLILGVGLGAPAEADYVPFGEDGQFKHLAERLDEGLEVLTGLWRGQPFSFSGHHYTVNDVTYLPRPKQLPHPPIWVAGTWPNKAPMRRAARWDGVFPLKMTAPNQYGLLKPSDLGELRAYVLEQRANLTATAPFDFIVSGYTARSGAEIVGQFAEAGATWWVEGLDWFGATRVEQIDERIAQGPPA